MNIPAWSPRISSPVSIFLHPSTSISQTPCQLPRSGTHTSYSSLFLSLPTYPTPPAPLLPRPIRSRPCFALQPTSSAAARSWGGRASSGLIRYGRLRPDPAAEAAIPLRRGGARRAGGGSRRFGPHGRLEQGGGSRRFGPRGRLEQGGAE
jgi:hypothetical protein